MRTKVRLVLFLILLAILLKVIILLHYDGTSTLKSQSHPVGHVRPVGQGDPVGHARPVWNARPTSQARPKTQARPKSKARPTTHARPKAQARPMAHAPRPKAQARPMAHAPRPKAQARSTAQARPKAQVRSMAQVSSTAHAPRPTAQVHPMAHARPTSQARPTTHAPRPKAQARPMAHARPMADAPRPASQARPTAHAPRPKAQAHPMAHARPTSQARPMAHAPRPTSQTRPMAHAKEPMYRGRVFIASYARSGSSFFGGIFNAHPDVFFIYEPMNPLLRIISQSSDAFLHDAEYVINSIAGCGFSDGLFLQQLSLFNHHRASSKPLVSPPFCNTSQETATDFAAHSNWQLCIDLIEAHALNEVCRNHTHVVMKIHMERLQPADLSWLRHISGANSFPVHILHLVRDPRAMLFSRYKLGWVVPMIRQAHALKTGEAEDNVERFCGLMERNLAETFRRPDRIELVRYEDLARNPEVVVKRLFGVLRISPSEVVLKWIQNKTSGSFNEYVFSLSRPGKFVLNAWRKTIPERLLNIIENKCERVMKYLGYLPTNSSQELLSDFEKPLFSEKIPLFSEKIPMFSD